MILGHTSDEQHRERGRETGRHERSWGASRVSRCAERQVSVLVSTCLWTLTFHYFYLLTSNHGDPTWWAGCVLTVAAVGSLLISSPALTAYSIYTAVLTIGTMALDRQL